MTGADLLRREFGNASRWFIKTGVPIFRAHERERVRDGKPVKLVVTDDDLDQIANAMSTAEAESNTLAVITPGHLDNELPEFDQPPTWGFLRNARVGTFGPGNVKCVLADEWYYRERMAEANEYPYRSSIYVPSKRRIMSLALLKNCPALDLGTHTNEVSYAYSFEDDMDTDPNAAANQQQQQAPVQEPLTPEEKTLFDKAWTYYQTLPGFPKSAAPEQEPNAEAAGGNTNIPGDDKDKPTPDGKNPPEDKDVKDKDEEKYKALEDQVKYNADELQKTRAELDRERCEGIVAKLEGEGYALDHAFEVETLVKYSADDRTKYVKNLRSRYQKVPGKGDTIPINTDPLPGDTGERELTKPEMQECVAYAAEKGWSGPAGFQKARKLKLENKMV